MRVFKGMEVRENLGVQYKALDVKQRERLWGNLGRSGIWVKFGENLGVHHRRIQCCECIELKGEFRLIKACDLREV